MNAITITVKDGCSAYTTNTVQGKRGSSTHSAEMAACKLGAKLLGAEFEGVQQIIDTSLPQAITRWELLSTASPVDRQE